MARQPPRLKRRMREHVIADQSINRVERFIIDEGYVVLRTVSDYGVDLVMWTFDLEGYVEVGSVSLQVKASEALRVAGGFYVYDLDIRDYNLWKDEVMPICLVLYDAGKQRAYWLELRELFRDPAWRGPRTGARTVRIQVPMSQQFNRRAVARLRLLKNRVCETM